MKLWCCVDGQVKHYVDYQLGVELEVIFMCIRSLGVKSGKINVIVGVLKNVKIIQRNQFRNVRRIKKQFKKRCFCFKIYILLTHVDILTVFGHVWNVVLDLTRHQSSLTCSQSLLILTGQASPASPNKRDNWGRVGCWTS